MKKRDKKNPKPRSLTEKEKKGLSTVIISLMLIAMVLIVIGVTWGVISNIIKSESEFTLTLSSLLKARMKITDVNADDLSSVEVSVKKLTGEKELNGTEIIGEIKSDVDIISVVDLSGSMRYCESAGGSCCDYNLQGYGSPNCYGLLADKEDACTNVCSGTWVDRLTPTQNANKNLIETIQDSDNQIGLVTYSDGFLDASSTDLEENISLLTDTIDLWAPWGGTCICCGINAAVDKFQAQSSPEHPKAIIVMSDGDTNVKCSEQGTGNAIQDAIQSAEDANQTLNNLVIYSIGFGTGVNKATLEAIAEKGNGQYFSAENESQLLEKYKAIEGEIINTYSIVKQFDYLLLVFYNATHVHREEKPVPEIYETETYQFDLTVMNNIERIEIYLVAKTASGRDVTGSLLDSWEA